MVLIFWGTLDQVHLGIYGALEKYFRSFFIFWNPEGTDWQIPVSPGGYLVGSVLFLNLIVAHAVRFKWRWTKSGIFMIHLGLICLLLGEMFTGLFSKEGSMWLNEGETRNYSEAFRKVELVVIDKSDPRLDTVVAIPEKRLKDGASIVHSALPFALKVHRFMPNSLITRRNTAASPALPISATVGTGAELEAREIPRTGKTDERDIGAAFVEIVADGKSLGIWMLSNILKKQAFQNRGKEYEIALRQKRYYKAFSIRLLDFTHERYSGTDIPKNFSSRVRLIELGKNEDREVLIYMNHPLRYGGYTFYQAGFDNNDQTSILQVVRNPTWIMPYVSCILIALGLTIQFSLHLTGFIRKRTAQ